MKNARDIAQDKSPQASATEDHASLPILFPRAEVSGKQELCLSYLHCFVLAQDLISNQHVDRINFKLVTHLSLFNLYSF